MTEATVTEGHERQGFTVETFAQFWANPQLDGAQVALADDVVGYWPGEDQPVKGRRAYVGVLAELLRRVPDLTLTVAESATHGESLFILWTAHATGAGGRAIEQTGIDRIKIRDGQVIENRIFFDREQFQRKLGTSLAL